MCRLGRWIKGLFVKTDLVEMAELYLLTRRVDPREAAMIRKAIVEIKSVGVDEAIKREARRQLKKLLEDYLMD